MNAWLLDRIGDGIEKIRIGDVPDPTPKPGEVVLEILAAALNPADRYLAMGQYPARPVFPHILGRDGVGRVIAVGDGVPQAVLGQMRVVLPCQIGADWPGTFAQRVSVPLNATALSPSSWTTAEAAAAPLVDLTALQALTQWGSLPPSLLLISGASGGVGVSCTQLGQVLGHTVIGLSRDPKKSERLLELGATHVFDPQHADMPRQLLAATGGRRVGLAIDQVGGESFNAIVGLMADRGVISVVGRLAGPVPNFNTAALFFRRIRIGGVIVTGDSIEERARAWTEVVRMRGSATRPIIDSEFPFESLPVAFDRLVAAPMGKVILKP